MKSSKSWAASSSRYSPLPSDDRVWRTKHRRFEIFRLDAWTASNFRNIRPTVRLVEIISRKLSNAQRLIASSEKRSHGVPIRTARTKGRGEKRCTDRADKRRARVHLRAAGAAQGLGPLGCSALVRQRARRDRSMHSQ